MAGGNGTWQRKVNREVMQCLDTNKDGTLSLYEVMSGYKKIGVRAPIQHAYMTVLSVDEDGDGVIKKESEVAALATYLRHPSSYNM